MWGRRNFTILPGTHPGPPVLDGETGDSGQGGSPPPIGSPSVPVDTYQIYDGTDEHGIVGTVPCWRMVYENPVGHGTHCMQPVEVGRAVEVLRRLDEGVELRPARRRVAVGQAPTYSPRFFRSK